MTHYLIDSENVGLRFNRLTDQLNAGDEILLFYTESNKNTGVPVGLIDEITRKEATVKAVRCHRGSNALDFQLVSYLGYLAAKSPADDSFAICSNDGGYDAVLDFWKERGVAVTRLFTDCAAPRTPRARAKKTEQAPPAALPSLPRADCLKAYQEQLLASGIEEKYVTHIAGILYRNITLPKKGRNMQIQNQIRKSCGEDRGANLFGLAKPVIEHIDKNGPLPRAQGGDRW